MHLTQGIKRAIQVNGSGMATICGERAFTWRECGERVAKFAGALNFLGISGGERVAILALNSDRYFEFFIAVPWAGGAFVPVNNRLAPPEVAYWLNDSGSEVLLIDDQFVPVLKAIRRELKTVRHVIYIGDGETPEGMLDYEELVAKAAPAEDAGRGYDDLAGILYTGGTTGQAKGVMLSHRNIVCNCFHVIPAFGFQQGMRWLHAGPMFHIADGLSVTGVTMVAGEHIFIPMFEPIAVMEAIQKYKVTDVLLVPTMINMLVHHPEVSNYDLSSLTHMAYGASPMPEAVILRALEVLPGCKFTHAYGQTECAPLVTMNGDASHRGEGLETQRYKSAGRAALGVEIKIVDEDGKQVANGDVGELCVRGPNVMLGYWNKPEETEAALRDGWMHSGDGAYLRDDGYVFIVDRVKDMIITGGENVYSAEVENALHQHPDVLECAVIGVPDEKWGERVHAIARLREGTEAREEDIISHAHTLIAGFKCPRSVSFRDEPLPLSGAGKILKTELRKPYWEGKAKQVN